MEINYSLIRKFTKFNNHKNRVGIQRFSSSIFTSAHTRQRLKWNCERSLRVACLLYPLRFFPVPLLRSHCPMSSVVASSQHGREEVLMESRKGTPTWGILERMLWQRFDWLNQGKSGGWHSHIHLLYTNDIEYNIVLSLLILNEIKKMRVEILTLHWFRAYAFVTFGRIKRTRSSNEILMSQSALEWSDLSLHLHSCFSSSITIREICFNFHL